jgi:RNA-binding protein
MSGLSAAQRKHLRGLAHSLAPAVQIGKQGLTETVVRSLDEALAARELIKVKFVAAKEEKLEITAEIDARLGSTCVGTIGHLAILYREHPDPEKRRIRLPR